MNEKPNVLFIMGFVEYNPTDQVDLLRNRLAGGGASYREFSLFQTKNEILGIHFQ